VPEGLDNLLERLNVALPVRLRHIPDRLRDTAFQLDLRVAISGGIPRDLIRLALGQLTRETFTEQVRDFDIVVEGASTVEGGAAIPFAYELVRRLPGKLTLNPAFQTASIATDDGVRIDLTTARTEEYPSPGVLPVVEHSGVSIEYDLPRRDFTMNATALELAPAIGRLVDPLGGAGDIADKLIRVIHGNSFIDDPTRLLRALRYSLRLDYNIEAATREMLQSAIDDDVLDYLSPERVRYEVECICSEPRWVEMWSIMDLTRITDALSAALGGMGRFWKLEDAGALDIALNNQTPLLAQDSIPRWLVRLAWLLRSISDEHLETVTTRLGLFPRQVQLIQTAREVLRTCARPLADELAPSQITQLLEGWPRAAVALALFTFNAEGDSARLSRRHMLRYLDSYSLVRSELTGRDLMAMGAPAGPELRKLRDTLRYLRLDGTIADVETETEFARGLIAELPVEQEPTGGAGS
jgi:tRNA nucleotidyltransferase (CCA-adding enzyme)